MDIFPLKAEIILYLGTLKENNYQINRGGQSADCAVIPESDAFRLNIQGPQANSRFSLEDAAQITSPSRFHSTLSTPGVKQNKI